MDMPRLLRAPRRQLRLVMLGLALGHTLPAWSTPIEVTFEQALRQAVDRAPTLAARDAQVAASSEEAQRAAALPDPRLIVGVDNLPINGPDAFSLDADEMTTQQVGLMQEFPARAKRDAQQAIADAGVTRARALSAAELGAVKQAAAQAWVELWSAQQSLQALVELREPARLAERTARARLGGGSAGASDVLAAQAAVLALENRIELAQSGLDSAQAGLARWLGGEPSALHASGEPPDFARLPFSEARLLGQIDRQRPLLDWEAREATAQAQVEAAIAETRPDWSLEVTYGRRERAPDGMPRSDMVMVEVGVGLPLFAKNRQAHGIAARRSELEMVVAERDEARRSQAERVRRTLATWRGLGRQVSRQSTDSLPLARDRSRIALAAYGAGDGLQPWLEARRDEIELNLEYARLLGEQGRAWAALAYLLPEEEGTP